MSLTSDNEKPAEDIRDPAPDVVGPAVNTGRRHFTRNALVSGSVLLSLWNRPAWSQPRDCVSGATFRSWEAGTYLSHHPEGDVRWDASWQYNESQDEYCAPVQRDRGNGTITIFNNESLQTPADPLPTNSDRGTLSVPRNR